MSFDETAGLTNQPPSRGRSAAGILLSDDPLSEDACSALLAYREEDSLVDFKELFDPKSDKSWLDLAVDCTAFANTEGGFIVFGIKDKTWEPVGSIEKPLKH